MLDLVRLQMLVAEGAAAAVRRRAAAARPRHRGPALRRGSGARRGCRRPARCTASACPGVAAEFRAADRAGPAARLRRRGRLGDRRALRPAAGQGDRLGADPSRGRPGCSPRRWPAPRSTAWSPTATCSYAYCAIRRSDPAASTPASSTGTRRCSRRWCRRWTPRSCRAWRPRWPARPPAVPRDPAERGTDRLAQRRRHAAGHRVRRAGRAGRGVVPVRPRRQPGLLVGTRRRARGCRRTRGSRPSTDPEAHPPVPSSRPRPTRSAWTSPASGVDFAVHRVGAVSYRGQHRGLGDADRAAALPGRREPDIAEGSLHRAAARRGRPGAGRARPAGRRRRTAADARSDEAGTPVHAPAAGRSPRCRSPPAPRSTPEPSSPSSHPN